MRTEKFRQHATKPTSFTLGELVYVATYYHGQRVVRKHFWKRGQMFWYDYGVVLQNQQRLVGQMLPYTVEVRQSATSHSAIDRPFDPRRNYCVFNYRARK